MDDSTIKFLFAALFVSFMAIRVYYHRKAQVEGGEFTYREKHLAVVNVLRQIGAIILLGTFVSYFVKPEWLGWASIPLPLWMRWVGVAVGYGSVRFIWWTQASLGKNFNTTLHARKDHTLVTHGPFRWIRHPMYSGLFLFTASWLLISANWVVGLPGLLSLTLIVINRLRHEEATMIELFGDQYREYMRHTGRFLPRVTVP
jgi:protein-S-isoprenylcysteine O-methyltransferase Ste14